MRCAVLEFTRSHTITLPLLVRILNDLGEKPDVYLRDDVIAGRPFAASTKLRFRLRRAQGLRAVFPGLTRRLRSYDLLVANTLEHRAAFATLSRLSVPTLALVHNLDLVAQDKDYMDYFGHPRRHPLVLSHHIHAAATRRLNPGFIAPVLEVDPYPFDAPRAGYTLFCVQGQLEYSRRNYPALLDAVEGLVREGYRRFATLVLGRTDKPDSRVFRRSVEKRALRSFVHLSVHDIPTPDFYRFLSLSHFVLPLVDRSNDALIRYFRSKVTTSLFVTLGMGIPWVADAEFACACDLRGCAIAHRDGRLMEGMKNAMEIREHHPDGYKELRKALLAKKINLIEESTRSVRAAISQVC